jgi:HAD superfamily hydrolase (TIGR01509 family)
MAMVDNVVFDVGRVLIDLQYGAFFDLLQSRGASIASVEDFIDRADLHRYEHGEMSSAEFLERVNGLLSEPLPPAELAAAWNDLFSPIQEMLDLAALLKAHCGVYLLSNTSELHWEHLARTFAFDRICHDRLASYQVGAMKPDPEIFSAACQHFGLRPERTVFIDDLEKNVRGAQACGWYGVWHREIAATKAELQQLTGLSL